MSCGTTAFAAWLTECISKPDALRKRLDASAKLLEQLVTVRRVHPDVCPSEKLDRVGEQLDRWRGLMQVLSEDMRAQADPFICWDAGSRTHTWSLLRFLTFRH